MENLNQKDLSQPKSTTKDQNVPKKFKSKNNKPSFSKKKSVSISDKVLMFKTSVVEHTDGKTSVYPSNDFTIDLKDLPIDTYLIIKRLVSAISAHSSKDVGQLISKEGTNSAELLVLSELVGKITNDFTSKRTPKLEAQDKGLKAD